MHYLKGCAMVAACVLCVACGARQDKTVDVENDTLEVQNSLREMEQRMAAMERRMETVSTDVGLLVSKTFEPKDKKGRKTDVKPKPAGRYVVPPAKQASEAKPAAASLALPPTGVPVSVSSAPATPPVQSVALPPTAAPQAATPSSRTVVAPPSTGKIVAAGESSSPSPVPALPPAASSVTPSLPPETSGGVPTTSSSQTAKPVAPSKGEEAAYKAALALATSGKPAAAQAKFKEFLQAYPSSKYAPNAHYWIGECLYAQHQYREALLQFKEVTTRYPRHHKSADALLKAGMTYNRLGNKENAELQYKALMTDFPKSEAARRVPRDQR